MLRDPYASFAGIYDAWQDTYPKAFSEAVLPFYESEIVARGFPDRSIVDIACGTGTFLRLWSRRHPEWRLLGTDQSAAMLRVGRRKLRAAEIRARLLCQAAQRLELPRPVGVAVCVFDSVNHLRRVDDLRRFFKGVHRLLLPGGLLLFDVVDERAFSRLFQGTWTIDDPNLFVSVCGESLDGGQRGIQRFRAFERRGRTWRRTDFAIEERNWRQGQIEDALRRAGLLRLRSKKIQPYPPDEVEAPRSLWVCRRPGPETGGDARIPATRDRKQP